MTDWIGLADRWTARCPECKERLAQEALSLFPNGICDNPECERSEEQKAEVEAFCEQYAPTP
jgi:hypothetical protein